MEELRDIKDIVEVTDHSLLMLVGLSVALLLLLALGFYLFANRRRRRKKQTPREMALERLRGLDFGDTKSVVYTFESDGRLWTTQKNQEAFDEIEKELYIYKYKREIPPLDEEIEKKIKSFIKELK